MIEFFSSARSFPGSQPEEQPVRRRENKTGEVIVAIMVVVFVMSLFGAVFTSAYYQ